MQILYWCEETVDVPFETGIQRVTRRLADALFDIGADVVPVGWDTRTSRLVRLAGLRPLEDASSRKTVLFVPEVPLNLMAAGLDPVQIARAYGLPSVALIHDLIPIKRAADYSADAVAAYRDYYRRFAGADLLLTTTRCVASDLRSHLASAGHPVPPIEIVPLPAQLPRMARRRPALPTRGVDDPLRLVAVTTWEPRKNVLALLRAIEAAARETSAPIHLDLVGRRGVFPAYDEEVLAIARGLPAVALHGSVSDSRLAALYERSHASVYPSTEEGFGMPIGESLWMGRACLCHDASAMAEVAPGGGTLMIDMTDERAIAGALRRLATSPETLARLNREAQSRPLRDWKDFATDVAAVLSGR